MHQGGKPICLQNQWSKKYQWFHSLSCFIICNCISNKFILYQLWYNGNRFSLTSHCEQVGIMSYTSLAGVVFVTRITEMKEDLMVPQNIWPCIRVKIIILSFMKTTERSTGNVFDQANCHKPFQIWELYFNQCVCGGEWESIYNKDCISPIKLRSA